MQQRTPQLKTPFLKVAAVVLVLLCLAGSVTACGGGGGTLAGAVIGAAVGGAIGSAYDDPYYTDDPYYYAPYADSAEATVYVDSW